MNHRIVIFIGVILFILLCIICIRSHANGIENKLAARSNSALKTAGIHEAIIVFDGRNAVISGTVDSESASEKIRALIGSLEGVRSVTGKLTIKKSDSVVSEPIEESKMEVEKKTEIDLAALLAQSNIYFDTNSAELNPQAHILLKKITDILKEKSHVYIEIAGHTDNSGAFNYNEKLSLRRANNVQSFLISNGVPKKRFKIMGYGETCPIADNTEIAGMSKNRRVEFSLIKED